METVDSFLRVSHYCLPVLAVFIVLLCLRALLRRRMPSLGKARIVNEANGKTYPLRYRETSLGRSKTCDIVLDYPTVSRLHAVIVCAKEGWYIAESSGSQAKVNGLKVNKRADIASGDKITLGNVNLKFENSKETPRPRKAASKSSQKQVKNGKN